jgi:hypothetical protein
MTVMPEIKFLPTAPGFGRASFSRGNTLQLASVPDSAKKLGHTNEVRERLASQESDALILFPSGSVPEVIEKSLKHASEKNKEFLPDHGSDYWSDLKDYCRQVGFADFLGWSDRAGRVSPVYNLMMDEGSGGEAVFGQTPGKTVLLAMNYGEKKRRAADLCVSLSLEVAGAKLDAQGKFSDASRRFFAAAYAYNMLYSLIYDLPIVIDDCSGSVIFTMSGLYQASMTNYSKIEAPERARFYIEVYKELSFLKMFAVEVNPGR